MQNLAASFTDFYLSLQIPPLPKSIVVLHPQKSEAVKQITHSFFEKFYNDSEPRHLLLGINPGRFGAGITGINFTGPLQLSQYCSIAHTFGEGTELSAEFIYQVIEAFGGATSFYSRFFLGAMCPLGLVQAGKNINYYDDATLQQKLLPFITACIQQQHQLCGSPTTCICIGEGKNLKVPSTLNEKHQWFTEIRSLPHPRFVMQYRRKQLADYINLYLETLQ